MTMGFFGLYGLYKMFLDDCSCSHECDRPHVEEKKEEKPPQKSFKQLKLEFDEKLNKAKK